MTSTQFTAQSHLHSLIIQIYANEAKRVLSVLVNVTHPKEPGLESVEDL